jgi:hypothetical protein
MKRIILVLGIIASSSLTFSYPSQTSYASDSKLSVKLLDQNRVAGVDYIGRDEDGQQEDVKTGRGRRK